MRTWGAPTTLAEVSKLFSSYLQGKLASIPWSEEPLRAETSAISRSLIRLNDERHWWTVGSQPAVDGAPSAHPVHGFGPKGGFVYQKAFVEFFLSSACLDELEKRAQEEEQGRKDRGEAEEGHIKWFAGNRKGQWRTNMNKGDVNAVTWGVFGGKEIVTTTLIEEMSFKAWNVRPVLLLLLGAVADNLSTTGGGLFDLERVVPPVSRQFARSHFCSRSRRLTMARLCHPPRLQE